MRAAIRELQQSMGNEVREYFEIEADGSFSTDVLVLMAERNDRIFPGAPTGRTD